MHMWIQLIQMYNECGNILFTISAADKWIDILCPTFNLTLPFYVSIVRTFFKIDFLLAKCEFLHPCARAPKNDIYDCTESRFFQTFIGILYASFMQQFSHSLRNAPAFVDRTDLTSWYDFKIQVFTCRVIITKVSCPFPTFLCPIAHMFITLSHCYPFGYMYVKYLFCICHIVSVLFCTIHHVPACCLFGHVSLRR